MVLAMSYVVYDGFRKMQMEQGKILSQLRQFHRTTIFAVAPSLVPTK